MYRAVYRTVYRMDHHAVYRTIYGVVFCTVTYVPLAAQFTIPFTAPFTIPFSGVDEEPYPVEDQVVPKSDEERLCILQAIKTNFLFDHTTDRQKEVHSNICQ